MQAEERIGELVECSKQISQNAAQREKKNPNKTDGKPDRQVKRERQDKQIWHISLEFLMKRRKLEWGRGNTWKDTWEFSTIGEGRYPCQTHHNKSLQWQSSSSGKRITFKETKLDHWLFHNTFRTFPRTLRTSQRFPGQSLHRGHNMSHGLQCHVS